MCWRRGGASQAGQVAAAESNYGAMLTDNHDPRAVAILERSIVAYVAEYGEDSVDVAQCRANLALALARTEPARMEEAQALLERALVGIRAHQTENSLGVFTGVLMGIGLERRSRSLDAALAGATQIESQLIEAGLGEGSIMADLCAEQATILVALGRFEEAHAALVPALRARLAAWPEG